MKIKKSKIFLTIALCIITTFFVSSKALGEIISIEAEDLGSLDHTINYNDATSWGCAFIDIGSSEGNSSSDFYAPSEEEYNIWLRIKGLASERSYSLILSINGFDITVSGNNLAWKWVNEDSFFQKISVPLTQGKNTITIKKNPDTLYAPAQVDSIIISNNLNYQPSDIPPLVYSWENIISNGFGDVKNHEAKMMDYNGSLYVSTSNINYHPGLYKSDDGINFTKVFDYGSFYTMYRTLDLKYLDIGANSGLYVLTDTSNGTACITKVTSGQLTPIPIGYYYRYDNGTYVYFNPRGYWAKDMISFNGYAYAGFSNDAQLYFTMRRTRNPASYPIKTPENTPVTRDNPLIFPARGGNPKPTFELPWTDVSLPAFGKDSQNKYYGNISAESNCVFKGYLYIGTYNRGYFGRTTQGAQIWRTSDGTTWEPCVLNGFGSTSRSSISHMTVFGGYLYATTSEAFGPNYIYRSKDGLTWEQAFSGLSSEPYIGDITSYMGRLYITTYNWGGRVYSSPDGINWTPVSDKYINNNSANSLIGDLQPFKNSLYVNTRNMTTGTNIFRGKLFKDLSLNAIGNKSIYEDQILDFAINAIGEPLLRYFASNLSNGATFSSETQKFLWEPLYGQAGIYSNVNFEVSDGFDNQIFENISITVLKTVIYGDVSKEGHGEEPVGVNDATLLLLDETQTNVLAEATTDSTGHFNIFNNVWQDGTYYMKISKLGYEDSLVQISVSNNSTTPLNSTLISYVRITSPQDGAVIYTEP